ncbi:MAG: DUF2142 domain-containing protein [Oscillospiraceae bacterium]|nr:DUF2142 domain-containing protein [Oscillospiraceae bacterium]
MNKNPVFGKIKLPPPWALWLLLGLLAVAASGVVVYAWRVFYSLDARGWPAGPLFLAGAALALALVGAAWFVCRRLHTLPARAVGCILLAGALFCFANPPMQAPDEYNHYLRSYSISQGRFDFDASREYPQDVSRLYNAFPGAWVSAHTSQGLTKDDAGNTVTYNSQGYALKQRGETGPVESVAGSFAEYLAGGETAPVSEPILFMVLPFLPQALGMLLARLLGFGALGCLYGGRLVNLCVYAFFCYKALKNCDRGRGVMLAFVLMPLSLYMAASLSYDAYLLGCYYLCASYLAKETFDKKDACWFGAAFLLMNVAKPYINLLWLLVLFFVPAAGAGRAKPGRAAAFGRRAALAFVLAAGAVAVSLFTSWYGVAMRSNYGEIGRMLGEDVQQVPQLMFVLKNPLRYIAVFLGTLYENDFFLGQLGLFGALDLPVAFLNLTGPAVLLLAAALTCQKGKALGGAQCAGGAAFALLYIAGVATAMYITYTPVGMVRIIGLQARYFLPAFLMLFWLGGKVLGRALCPAVKDGRGEALSLLLCGSYAVLGAVLLFQHYFVGPVYLIR